MSTYLFVYGTLKSEFVHEVTDRLQREARFVGNATIKGSIYDLGAHPGFVKDSKDLVHGELYHIITPESFIWLDEYEEAPILFLRREVKATIMGEKVLAYVYEYPGHVYQYEKIEGGNYTKIPAASN